MGVSLPSLQNLYRVVALMHSARWACFDEISMLGSAPAFLNSRLSILNRFLKTAEMCLVRVQTVPHQSNIPPKLGGGVLSGLFQK